MLGVVDECEGLDRGIGVRRQGMRGVQRSGEEWRDGGAEGKRQDRCLSSNEGHPCCHSRRSVTARLGLSIQNDSAANPLCCAFDPIASRSAVSHGLPRQRWRVLHPSRLHGTEAIHLSCLFLLAPAGSGAPKNRRIREFVECRVHPGVCRGPPCSRRCLHQEHRLPVVRPAWSVPCVIDCHARSSRTAVVLVQ